jgi:S-adenosyl-L-methionine hydrolase (adenosine-forming)
MTVQAAMIFLFTDFGADDLYVGQLKARLLSTNPDARIIDLLHQAPNFDARSGAHLLAALAPQLAGGVTLAVVDAGVGSERRPVAVQADDSWYIGPDNGLLSVLAARARTSCSWEIVWRPQHLSHSFHGRDLFAPIASMLASGQWWPHALREVSRLNVDFGAADLARVIYTDHYGNALTGLRNSSLPQEAVIMIAGHKLRHARVFSEASQGTPFWYENSLGLVEIAVNCGNAAQLLGIGPGSPLKVIA